MSEKGKRRRSPSASSLETAPSKGSQKTARATSTGSSKVMKILNKLVEGKAREETEIGISSGKSKSKKPKRNSAKSGPSPSADSEQKTPVVTVFKAGRVVVLNCGLESETVSIISFATTVRSLLPCRLDAEYGFTFAREGCQTKLRSKSSRMIV